MSGSVSATRRNEPSWFKATPICKCQALKQDLYFLATWDIFLGGTETSATTVEWSMAELLKNPNKMKKAQEEVRRVFGSKGYVDESEFRHLKYVSAVIKETLRLHPPAPLLLPRENSKGCKINGYEIPPKTKVIINSWAIGRDSKYWDEPEKFEPERFLNASIDYNFKGTEFEYIPFGSGRRYVLESHLL